MPPLVALLYTASRLLWSSALGPLPRMPSWTGMSTKPKGSFAFSDVVRVFPFLPHTSSSRDLAPSNGTPAGHCFATHRAAGACLACRRAREVRCRAWASHNSTLALSVSSESSRLQVLRGRDPRESKRSVTERNANLANSTGPMYRSAEGACCRLLLRQLKKNPR